jgi:hypothetical protein
MHLLARLFSPLVSLQRLSSDLSGDLIASKRDGVPSHRCGVRLATSLLGMAALACVPAGAQVTQLTNWVQQHPGNTPSTSFGNPLMVYDAATGQVVLFDGEPNETWTWDGSNWTQQQPANNPPLRQNAMMAYDATHQQVVLFGGTGSSGDLNDTWTWDGSNWTQQSPTTSPSARVSGSMAYDASTNQVVLFGGQNGSGLLNDTWMWNGSNWMQQSPTTSPSARFLAATAYDTSTNQAVLFGGKNGSGILNDTWTWNGSNWTQQSPTTIPPARFFAAMAYDASTNQIVLFGGDDSNGVEVDTWVWQTGSPNLGTANVCPSGTTTPSPCSQQITIGYSVAASSSTAIGSIQILTQGASNLDFQATPNDTSTTLCQAQTYSIATTCTVDVTFTPTAPGQRIGAVVFKDGSGNLLSTTYINGTGTGPQVAFLPGTQSNLPGGNDALGVAVDGAGNYYVADGTSGNVYKYPSNTEVISLGTANITSVAVDGAGNLFIADDYNGVAYEYVLNSTGSYTQITLPSIPNGDPYSIAVDGSGNVYVGGGDGSDGVYKFVPNGSGGFVQSTVASLSFPRGITVDAAGNVYVAMVYTGELYKFAPNGSGGYTQSTVASDLNDPINVAVDLNGNVYVVNYASNDVLEYTPSGSSYIEVGTVASGLSGPWSLAVDAGGNLYIGDLSVEALLKIDVSDPPSLSFATTAAGSTSSDSPKTVTVWNNGNATLSFPIPTSGNNPSIATNFTLNGTGSSACPIVGSGSSAAGTLAADATCTLSISFAPQAAGPSLALLASPITSSTRPTQRRPSA